MIFLYFADSSH